MTKNVVAMRDRDDAVPATMKPSTRLRAFRILTWIGYLVAIYLIVLATARYVLPLIAMFLAVQTKMNTSTQLPAMISFWLLPLVFVAALILIGELKLFRWLRSLVVRLNTRAASWPVLAQRAPSTSSGEKSVSISKMTLRRRAETA